MSEAYQALIDSLRDHQNGGRRNECEEAARAIETLRAELTEARRKLKEASEQEPVGCMSPEQFSILTGDPVDNGVHVRIWQVYNPPSRAKSGVKLYAAPVQQPADDFRNRLIALCQQWTPSNLDRCETPEEIIREVAEGPHSQPAVSVDDICNAYESGVGHNGRPTANVNPYPPGTPQHTAYELGAKGTKHNAPAVPEAVAKDIDKKLQLQEYELFDPMRFNETCEDGEGYDLPKDRMRRLAEIGVLRWSGGSRYSITELWREIIDAAILSATDSEVKNG